MVTWAERLLIVHELAGLGGYQLLLLLLIERFGSFSCLFALAVGFCRRNNEYMRNEIGEKLS